MKTATPESVGVPSSAITAYLRALHDSKFNMNSVLILRHGKLISESYQPPYNKEVKRTLASVSKTFTAIAAGLLIDEGKLSLQDKVVSFFPEYCPQPVHPLLAAATIEDMLTMRDSHNNYTHGVDQKVNWLESWFLTPPDHPPGTVFQYNTTCTNLVASIIERVTGMKMVDYMYPRLLTPLGFSEGCCCGESPDGDSAGGSSMICTTRDVARLALLVMNDGEWEGRQLISKEFIRNLRSPITDNSLMGISVEGMMGYGYYTWQVRHGGFAMYGINGQFAVGFPENGLLVVTTGNTSDHYSNDSETLFSQFVGHIYNNLLPALSDTALPEDRAAYEELRPLSVLPHMLAPGVVMSSNAETINGKTFKMHPNHSGWKTVRFEFSGDRGKLCYTNRRGDKEIDFGFGYALPITFPEKSTTTLPLALMNDFGFDTHSSAGWINDHILSIHIYVVRGGYMQLNAVFTGDIVTIAIKPASGFRNDYGGYMYGVAEL